VSAQHRDHCLAISSGLNHPPGHGVHIWTIIQPDVSVEGEHLADVEIVHSIGEGQEAELAAVKSRIGHGLLL
jgi:hypothetical protein